MFSECFGGRILATHGVAVSNISLAHVATIPGRPGREAGSECRSNSHDKNQNNDSLSHFVVFKIETINCLVEGIGTRCFKGRDTEIRLDEAVSKDREG
jgi:hypothetical protein